MLLHGAEIAPAWRRLGGVGWALVVQVLRWPASTRDVVAITPYPLQHSGGSCYHEEPLG